jgi:hypothetical protein
MIETATRKFFTKADILSPTITSRLIEEGWSWGEHSEYIQVLSSPLTDKIFYAPIINEFLANKNADEPIKFA